MLWTVKGWWPWGSIFKSPLHFRLQPKTCSDDKRLILSWRVTYLHLQYKVYKCNWHVESGTYTHARTHDRHTKRKEKREPLITLGSHQWTLLISASALPHGGIEIRDSSRLIIFHELWEGKMSKADFISTSVRVRSVKRNSIARIYYIMPIDGARGGGGNRISAVCCTLINDLTSQT